MTSIAARVAAPVAIAVAMLAVPLCAGPSFAAGSAAPLLVKGRVLTIDANYLVFTTGDAVRLANVHVPQGLVLGRTVRVRIDSTTHLVTSVQLAAGAPERGEIDATDLPRDVVAVDSRSARSVSLTRAGAGDGAAGQVTVTIDVAVPDVTPPTDDIYLSTERTNFASAELRMNRVDAFRWTIALPLQSGSTLRYVFTRGSPATIERRQGGTVVTPRELTAAAGVHEHDRVERWSDKF